MTTDVLNSLFADAISLFPEEIAKIAGNEWNVVRSSSQLTAQLGLGGLWDSYVFSLTGIKPPNASIPTPLTRLTYNRATYQIAGVEQVGTSDMFLIHCANPQRPQA